MNKTPNKSAVQQSLTTESVVKENLTSEQRCKRIRTMYNCLNNLTDATSEGDSRDSIAKFIRKQQGYIERLLIREQKYSSELTAYREALKEIVKAEGSCYIRRYEAIAKAKQLTEK